MIQIRSPALIVIVGGILAFGGCGPDESENIPIYIVNARDQAGGPPGEPPSVAVRLSRPADGTRLKLGESFECVATVVLPPGAVRPTRVIAEFVEELGVGGVRPLAGNAKLSPARDGPERRRGSGDQVEVEIEYTGSAVTPKAPGPYFFYVEATTVTYVVGPSGSKPENRTTRIRSEEIVLEVD